MKFPFLDYFLKTKSRTLLGYFLAILLLWGAFYPFFNHDSPAPSLYRIARDPSWYPLSLAGKEQNMVAFSNELIYAIYQTKNIQIDLLSVGSNRLFSDLKKGEFDAVISSRIPDALSKEKYLFSDPFYLLGPVLIIKSSSNIQSLNDMGGKILGIKTGSSVVFKVEKYPSITIAPYENINLALSDLNKNIIDGAVMDLLPAHIYVQGLYNEKLKIIPQPLTIDGLRLVAKRKPEYAELIERFNEGLKEMKENGTYEQLATKWGLFNPEQL